MDKNLVPVFDSRDLELAMNDEVWRVLENHESGDEPLLYDVSDVSSSDPAFQKALSCQCTNQHDNTSQFGMCIESLFSQFGTSMNSDQVKTSMEYIIESRYNKYAKVIEGRDDYANLISQWADCTRELIWDVFCRFYKLISPEKKICHNCDLLKRSFWIVDRTRESLLYPLNDTKVKEEILFNMWGDALLEECAAIRKKVDPLSEDEKSRVDIDVNNEYFVLYIKDALGEAYRQQCPDMYYLSVNEKYTLDIENLFNDYVLRLRRAGVREKDNYKSAVAYWQEVAIQTIKRELLIDKVHSLLLSECLNPNIDLRDNRLSSQEAVRLGHEIDLAEKCMNVIRGCVNGFLSQLDSRCCEKPWAASLKQLSIDYRRLFAYMQAKHILSYAIKYEMLLDAFSNADFSAIYHSAEEMTKIYKKKEGLQGCVTFLIREIDSHVGRDWGEAAAHSIYKDLSPKDAFIKLQGRHVTAANEEFARDCLKECVPYSPKESKIS